MQNAIVKAGPLKPGTKIQVNNWQDHEEVGYYSCILLEDSGAYKTGDEVHLDKWELELVN